MAFVLDLGFAETKPATELINGEQRAKMSPQFTHARVQMRIAFALGAWTDAAPGRGRVGTEWRFYFLDAHGRIESSLVPDVAYVSFDRIPLEADEDAEKPTIAPDLAVEVVSPDERARDIETKVQLYFAYGVRCVAVADPRDRSLRVFHAAGALPTRYVTPQSAPIFEDLTLDLSMIYAPVR